MRQLAGLPILLTVSTLLICGCGGGGTTDSGPAPSTKLRIYQPGDQWEYVVTGSETVAGQTLSVTGSETRAVSSAMIEGNSVLAMTITDELNVNGQSLEEQTTDYLTQNPSTGDLTLVADTQGPSDTLRTVTTQEVTQKGTFASGSTETAKTTFSSGDTQTSTQITEGHSIVTVPAGTYNTWSVSTQRSDTNGVASSDLERWDPTLGNFVQDDVYGTEPGFTIHFTLKLASTTVPVQ